MSACARARVQAEELLDLLAQQPPGLAQVAASLLSDYYDAMYDYQARRGVEE